MMNRFIFIFIVLLSQGCRPEPKIQSYTVPKDSLLTTPVQSPSIESTPSLASQKQIPLHWHPPQSWLSLDSVPPRLAGYELKTNEGKALVTITSFPGEVGQLIDNVNRWRRQLQLGPLPPSDLSTILSKHQSDTLSFDYVTLLGSSTASQSMQVAILSFKSQTYFIKMMGDHPVVVKHTPEFKDFLDSFHEQ